MRVGSAGLALGLLLLGPVGCSYSLFEDGELEPETFESLFARVEITRGIRAQRPIDARVVSQGEIAAVVERAVVAERDPQALAGYEAGLVTVGLWPPDRVLVDELVAVMTEEVAGMYLPSERALYVVSDVPEPLSVWFASAVLRRDFMAEFALSHELVHLLQHQRYPTLLDDDDFYFAHDDAAIAAQSAFEGDAMYFGMLSMDVPLPAPEELEASFETALSDGSGALARAPALIRGLLGFPYATGYRLAIQEGGDLLEAPPASSEQAMHPEQRRAPFFAFDLSPLAESLPPDCEVAFQNTVGELQLSILLQDLSDGAADAAAWVGWDGDRYLAARCASGPALLWLTSWDTGADAAEFAAAYLEVAPRLVERAGFEEALQLRRVGRRVVVSSASLAPLEQDLGSRVERARVQTLAELRATVGAR